MSEIKLLPCPFCGKDAQIAPDEIGSGGQHVPPYHAGCLRGSGCSIAFTADDPDEAIAEWNRRAALSSAAVAEREPTSWGVAGHIKDKDPEWLKAASFASTLSTPPTSELEAEIARLKGERDDAREEVARYWTSADLKPWCDLAEEKGLGHFGKKLKGMFNRAIAAEDSARVEFDRAEAAEARLTEAMKALTEIDNLDEAMGHELTVKHAVEAVNIARRVREGGKVE